jgi:enediyne biosynthesis protein E4
MRRVVYLIFSSALWWSCSQENPQFEFLPDQTTGIEFNNAITEYDSFNILTFEYIYNGGGVGVGDFNNDGLSDLFFSGNMVENDLYLNLGDFKFKEVSAEAKVTGDGKWCSGIAVVDINADGWKDIYVCATSHPDTTKRKNILYINKGLNEDGVPVFEDLASAYNVADTTYTTNAAFLDYDNDGDLDLFLAVNKMTDGRAANIYRKKEVTYDRVDRLYRNDWDSVKNHPVFTDVSDKAGVTYEGYSLGVNVTDINQDGWADIYVTNDYLSMDIVYVNKGDGTFENKAREYFKHTSHSAMGNDVVDLNNDALPDVVAVDMLPEDNFRKKTMLGPNNYTNYINNEQFNIQHQYVRNTLQLNQGIDPATGNPLFSEVGLLSGISATDWSWTPLIADFDNDGFRDIIITNGFPKDVTDRDFVEYQNEAKNYASAKYLMNFMPSVKISNYGYRNTGGFTFDDVTDKWGLRKPSFSNGAVYADLDNDGDLDFIVNNINDRAFLYKNCAIERKDKQPSNWLKVSFKGTSMNKDGIGAKVWLYHSGGKVMYAEHSPYRGYLSSVEQGLHFGLGNVSAIDSIIVRWTDSSITKLANTAVNQVIQAQWSDNNKVMSDPREKPALFKDISSAFSYVHKDADFVDFNVQPLLIHKLSQYGPGIAVGDVNADGREDIYLGGSHNEAGAFLMQDASSNFVQKDLFDLPKGFTKTQEEMGVLLFDADGDDDLDLYSVSGGNEFSIQDSCYKDLFFENIKGRFVPNGRAIPNILSSGSCVRAADFDRDGDLDLFVGGRHEPLQYPAPVSSYILRNDSKAGVIKFTDVNDQIAPAMNGAGMICDAIWSDFDNDGWTDLIVAGEWAPVRFFKNDKGKLKEVSDTTISKKIGWWNSITGGDFDNDGDIDYVVGNLGSNTLAKATEKEPFSIYTADFDGNQKVDMIPTAFYKNMQGVREEFPYYGRLDIQKELIKTKAKFLKHADFGKATINTMLNDEQLKKARVLQANYFHSSYIENLGNGKFRMSELPVEVQIAPVFGMSVVDLNNDGNLDIMLVGNDFGTEVLMGRMDALNGAVLLGNGKGQFSEMKHEASGIIVRGDAKAAVLLPANEKLVFFASQNKDQLKVFESLAGTRAIALNPDVVKVRLTFSDGRSRIQELYYGAGFLSQGSRRLVLPEYVSSIVTVDYLNQETTLTVEK